MACGILDKGFKQSCELMESGGNKYTIYLIRTNKIERGAPTVVSNGEITALALTAASEMYKVEVNSETLNYTETLQKPGNNYRQALTFSLSSVQCLTAGQSETYEAALNARDFVQKLDKDEDTFTVAFQSAAGVWRVAGWASGFKIETNEFNSGTVRADVAMYNAVMAGIEQGRALITNQAVIDAVLADYNLVAPAQPGENPDPVCI